MPAMQRQVALSLFAVHWLLGPQGEGTHGFLRGSSFANKKNHYFVKQKLIIN